MIKLSIIIVNFNSGELLKKCLLTIRASFYPKSNFEIIIIDNNSTDSSISEAYSVKGITPKMIRNEKNLGFAKANNQAISRSNGNYILLLNPDTKLENNTLKTMVSFMDKNIEVGVSTCRVELPDGSIDDASHRGFPTPINALFHFLGLGKLFPQSLIFNGYHLGYKNMNETHEIDSCVGAFMLVRRKVGEKIGWLDEDYFWYGEDIDFCYRVKEMGFKVMYVPITKIIHYKGISSGIKSHSSEFSTANEETKRLATQARFDVMKIFYKKHYQNKYPKIITMLVLLAIELKRKVALL